jgi:hypothetical protein
MLSSPNACQIISRVSIALFLRSDAVPLLDSSQNCIWPNTRLLNKGT